MSRLSERLARTKEAGERALVCYVMAGDPDAERTIEIVKALDAAGVDAIELGIPFSDPLADGASVQASAYRALQQGMTVPKALQTLETIRAHSAIPVILMTYFNPTHRYGLEQFAKDAAAAGADGTIQTDLTPEEAQEWIEISRRTGLDTVFLLAPTSTPERIARVCRISTGFVYCVSRTGVTGAREDVPVELPSLLASVRAQTETPALVGFGISRPEHVRRIGAFADGVVVGSALVDVIAEAGTSPDLTDRVFRFAADLKQATREPQH